MKVLLSLTTVYYLILQKKLTADSERYVLHVDVVIRYFLLFVLAVDAEKKKMTKVK